MTISPIPIHSHCQQASINQHPRTTTWPVQQVLYYLTALVYRASYMKMASSAFKLLGPSWTRTFRCVWMFEELGVPYELVEKAMPRSKVVRQYIQTGKVPVLLEYDVDEEQTSSSTDHRRLDDDANGAAPFILTESTAINTYLADKFAVVPDFLTSTSTSSSNSLEPFAVTGVTSRIASAAVLEGGGEDSDSPLFMPRVGTRERALYNELLSSILTELDASLWVHRRHTALGKVFGHIPQITAPSMVNFYRVNAVLAQRCHPYLLGSHFTPADILYAHCLDWARAMGWHTSDEPLLQEWKVGGWPDHLDEYLRLCHARPAYQRAKRVQDANPSPLTAKI